MKFYSKEDVARAREMDLLTYLNCYEPGNLKHVSNNVYSTREHDSLIISNGKWCWFSRGIGGKSALDYLIKVKGIPFLEAVERIIGSVPEPLKEYKPSPAPAKLFVLPETKHDPAGAVQYLMNRGIDGDIIQWCIKNRYVFETAKRHCVLFVGYDMKGIPRYGAVRSIYGKFKGDVIDSDKHYAFRLVRAQSPRRVHVFESAPDLLSYATFVKLCGEYWRKETYLSLGGIGGSTLPKALEQFLKDYPDVSHIYLHLDNDEPGRLAVRNINDALKSKYYVRDCPPPSGKDYNDYLRMAREIRQPTQGFDNLLL